MKEKFDFGVYKKVVLFFWKYRRLDMIIAPLYYCFENFSTTISTIILVGFYDAVYNILLGQGLYYSRLLGYGILFILFRIIKEILQNVSSISTNAGIYEKSLCILNNNINEKSAQLPLIKYEESHIMDMKKKAEECVKYERIPSIFMQSVVLITSILGLFSLIITLGMYHWGLSVIALMSVGQFYIATYFQEVKKYKTSQELVQEKRRRDYIWSLFLDIKAIKEMRVMEFSNELSMRWKNSRDKINQKMWEEEKQADGVWFGCELLQLFGYLSGLVFSLFLVINNKISVGVFGAVLSSLAEVQTVIKNHLSSIGRIPVFLKYARNYFDFMDLPVEDEGEIIIEKEIESICFEDVQFKYPNSKTNNLDKINFKIHKGETIAVVGENGSGKTTLIKVLLGLYPIHKGSIRMNEIELENIKKPDLYKHISFVSQDYTIYEMSLVDNMVLASGTTNKEELYIILKQVGLEYLCNEKAIEETFIGREFGGIGLSGGQEQRLAIARAMLKKSDLVILDEPTSAIDPMQETEILTQFINMSQNKTSIIISHRIGICSKVDRIFVMKKGKIVETGSHHELLKENGEYARLYEAQSVWYKVN